MFLPGVHKSPNIQSAPDLYEIENLALDPEGMIEGAMREISDWTGKVVADMGAGTGFYVPMFAGDAAHVIAIEPHDPSRLRAIARVLELNLENVSVMTGSAERTLIRDRSVDVYHARFAYFWPPNCVGGIQELDRIMRAGGCAMIIDNDYGTGTFASWLARRKRKEPITQPEKERFWASYGFSCRKIPSAWKFRTRTDFESVVRLEFGKELGDAIVAEHEGARVDYALCLYHRRF